MALQRERQVGEAEVEAERRPLHRLENVQVERDPVATLSVAVLSVAAPGVGPVLIGSLDGGPSRHGYIHRQALATWRAAGSVLYDLPFGFSSVMDRRSSFTCINSTISTSCARITIRATPSSFVSPGRVYAELPVDFSRARHRGSPSCGRYRHPGYPTDPQSAPRHPPRAASAGSAS